jgi:hypothetical protein
MSISNSNIKTLLFSFDIKENVHYEPVPPKQTMNKAFYFHVFQDFNSSTTAATE